MTATKERPVIFSGPMVRAILAGRKTQTRRLVKPQPNWHARGTGPTLGIGCSIRVERGVAGWYGPALGAIHAEWGLATCPYGLPGDRLWVRETWGWKDVPLYSPDGAYSIPSGEKEIVYRADQRFQPDRWRSPIHMPRAASRITLEITGVRVERLTKVSSEDAAAEGFAGYGEFLEAFYTINAGRITYADDPWVWAITFKRVKGGGQ
jgi:hypothetical protein